MAVWTNADWKDIVDRINDLAQNPDGGCDAIAALPPVEADHVWTVQDVEAARDKLAEICSENEFSAELSTWKQDIIDELEAAIAEGWCDCCEEEDRGDPDYTGENTFAHSGGSGGFKLFSSIFSGGSAYITVDWAGWMRQQVEAPFEEEIPLATGETLILESGGPGWVGRQFARWEAFVELILAGPGTAIISGPVVDGYIFIGTEAAQTAGIAFDQAIRDERTAIIAQAEAQQNLNDATSPEAVAEAEAQLTEANADLDAKTAAREAAEAALDATPEAKHTPWIVNSPSAGVWVLTSQGEQSFQQTLSTPDFQHDRVFLLDPSKADRPYTIDAKNTDGGVQLYFRLLCE